MNETLSLFRWMKPHLSISENAQIIHWQLTDKPISDSDDLMDFSVKSTDYTVPVRKSGVANRGLLRAGRWRAACCRSARRWSRWWWSWAGRRPASPSPVSRPPRRPWPRPPRPAGGGCCGGRSPGVAAPPAPRSRSPFSHRRPPAKHSGDRVLH